MHILVVDDKEENRYLLETLLKGNNHDVETSSDGAEALDKLKSGNFELIISDILMPVMDGFQLCQTVKGDEALRHIPFIIYTATYTGSKDEALALKMGADRYIQKPCEPDVFMELVREVMASAGAGEYDATPATEPEEAILKLYNERLVNKLEQKMLQAEQEVQARQKTEQELDISNTRLQLALASANIGLWDWDIETGDLWLSPEWKHQLGYEEHEIPGRYEEWEKRLHPDDRGRILAEIDAYVRGRCPDYRVEFRLRHKDGSYRWIASTGRIVRRGDKSRRFMGCHVDITEGKRIQQQLIQAQKMESVGRLAGGVAHDFNNMLSVIIGHSELALEETEAHSSSHHHLKEIVSAAERSSAITRQLLAFARRQTITPRLQDLNETVERILKMLRRLIGEDIDLLWKPGNKNMTVEMDPSQIDQILANLCINARDAISGVGSITIETDKVFFDEAYCADHAGFLPGEYILLAVSDNGIGMEKETLDSIFEPFFTTKEIGRGTGLGLATVYGIVKQNEGFINVYSEPGEGTAFRVYLPHRTGKPVEARRVDPADAPSGHGETVLLVEDESAIRKMTVKMLERLNYTALAAGSPAEALRLAEANADKISLLLTDVIMPEMSGRDLSRQLGDLYPDIKTLFMSGYSASVIANRGVLDDGVNFIQKPFSIKNLADGIIMALHGNK